MENLSFIEPVEKTPDQAWAVIGDFSNIKKWASAVATETTEETPEGVFRNLVLKDGTTFRELLLETTRYSYSYTFARPGTKFYVGTVSVESALSGAQIHLRVRYAPADGADPEAVKDEITRFFRGTLKAMTRAVAG